ncbi:hypothetical protein LCGC14_2755320 [marine sediment metagenome]|uniref:Uncharacterized protein n=1 Tax=marine sediment metagenome TaxID=412755 RepID=A0A0F9BS71_9ZZZZ
MDEKEKDENAEAEKPDENKDGGSKSEADKKVELLNADTERINTAIAENENAKAREKLGGETDAGQVAEKKSEDEEWAEGAKERYKGTGMSPVEGDDGK